MNGSRTSVQVGGRLTGAWWALAAGAMAALLGAADGRAEEAAPAATAKVEPELKPDEALLAKIAALPDNTWLKLPAFNVAGDTDWLKGDPDKRRWGPFCRDYSNWMAWAPERKRALYCGGGHNIDPMNDVWEYDLASNTWVCLSAPDSIVPKKPRNQSLADFVKETAAFKDGVVRAKNGGPLRPAHTWCGLTYDQERRRMLFLDVHQGLLFTDRTEVAKGFGLAVEQFNAQRKPGSYIWAYDPVAKKWDGDVQTGVAGGEGAIMFYLPDQKTLWLKGAGGNTELYDPDKKQWKTLAKSGIGYGAVGAYDPDTKTAVVVNGLTTYAYSFAKNEWKTVQPKAPAGGRDATCMLHYDTAARKLVLYSLAVTPHLWLYDVEKNEWTDPKPQGDVPGGGRVAGYYDAERNVTVYYNSREVWVYRCKGAAAEEKEKAK